ncbi:MAG: flagellar hook-basal body complex protein FliE [Actinomycetia bacterium]|nr:flagellar hook-basal body complex protein FliE [Actinomycetes bacterium]
MLPVNLGTALPGLIGGGSGTPGTTSGSFAAQFLSALAGQESQAAGLAQSFASGGGAPVATVMAANAEADLMAQEFALLVSKALAAYQSIMNMQV